jgi:hypothetical protein
MPEKAIIEQLLRSPNSDNKTPTTANGILLSSAPPKIMTTYILKNGRKRFNTAALSG